MEIKTKVILGLGANLGDRLETLQLACAQLQKHVGQITSISSIYESSSWGFETSDKFFNACITIDTALTPGQLLSKIQLIEQTLGRLRNEGTARYTSRTIDIDILYFGKQQIKLPNLIVPHPEIPNRKFVLYPLQELNETFFQSLPYQTIEEMIRACADEIEPVSIIENWLQPF